MENQRVLLVGGGGYLGEALVEKLKLNNFEVIVMLRRAIPGYHYKYFIGDLLDKESLFKYVCNFDVVVDLASVIRTIRKSRYQENPQGLKNLIEAMNKNNLKRLIYLSSQNVNLIEKGPYAKSKELCEEILINSDLDYMIIRPSLIYGVDRQNDFYKLISLISRWRIAPIIGRGDNKMQPVLKEYVAEVIMNSINNFDSHKIIEVVGKETFSMNQIINHISKKLNISPIKIHIPLGVLKVFKKFVPFDLEGYTEDRVFGSCAVKNNRFSFFDNLDAIIGLCRKKS